MSEVLDRHYISQIISGGAIGADSLAERYALEKDIPLLEFIPDWDKFGKSAGMVRNKDIVKSCDILVSFWNGTSPGTKMSIDYARRLGKKVIIVGVG